jgi:hypothetical protein
LYFWHGLTANYEPQPNKYTVPSGRTVALSPVKHHILDNAVYEWQVDGAVQNGHTTEYFPYTATSSSGEHTVTVTAKLDGNPIASAETTVVHTGGASLRALQPNSSVNAAKLYSVVAPGQFGDFGGDISTYVGAGGFGGYTALKFDHSVTKKPGGEEIKIGGNAFVGWQEPGAIWVSQDDNNNGLADDTWYELAGSHTLAPLTRRNYAVTYRHGSYVDNLGNGEEAAQWDVPPAAVALGFNELTLVGTCLDISYNAVPLSGYADVLDDGRLSLSNAIQANGDPIDLPFIDFIKIVTAFHFCESPVGERSTEAYVPKDLSMADPDKQVNGVDFGDGQYRYTFKNYSGYDLTVEILEGVNETFVLTKGTSANPTTLYKTITGKSSIYIDCYGGNVKVEVKNASGLVNFTNG